LGDLISDLLSERKHAFGRPWIRRCIARPPHRQPTHKACFSAG